MPINYVCLDDEVTSVKGLIELLERDNKKLSVELRSPVPFDDEIRKLSKKNIDGLLLDLRLDKTPNEENNRVNYRALSLAQELRTRMTEKQILSFPIVLWSIDGNFEESYNRDKTGHDLFDFHFSKQSINNPNATVAEKMVALSEGYKKINELRSRTLKNIYAAIVDLKDEFDVLDARLANEISSERSYPTHVFADSVLNDLIRCSGILIDEEHLAARLGVDIKKSKDWNKLKLKFCPDCSYSGVFGKAWERWWMFKVSRKWSELYPKSSLQRLTAKDRVKILKEKFRLKDLIPIDPVVKEYDTKFWYVCYLTGKPISPVNSVRLSSHRSEWQDGVYASLDSILKRKHKKDEISLHPFEIERVKQIIEDLKNG